METRANFVTTGIAVLFAILAAFAFVYWVAKLDEIGEEVPLNFRIEGVVSGLAPGSEVHFNGIKIGAVRRVRFDREDPRAVYVIASVNSEAPIRDDTSATIAIQGLTGDALISLKGGSQDAPLILKNNDGGIPQLKVKPSAVSDILETVRIVSARADRTLALLETMIDENSGSINASIKNVEKFTTALGENADDMNNMLKNISTVGTSLADLGGKLDGTIKGVEGLVNAINPQDVSAIIANVSDFSNDLKSAGTQLGGIAKTAQQTLISFQGLTARLDKSVDKIDQIFASIKPADIQGTVGDVREAAAQARKIVDDVSTVSKTLNSRADDINQIITNATEMTATLNASSQKVGKLMDNLNGFLASEDSRGVGAELTATLSEFRNMAQTITARSNEIARGLQRFTGSGLRNADGMISDVRRSVARIENVVRQLENNPSGFLLGNSPRVRTYKGRQKQ